MTVPPDLAERGYAVLPGVLDPAACAALRLRFDDLGAFRKTINMEPLGYGRGLYRYFAAPLPAVVERLRSDVYAALAPVANTWAELLGEAERYPATLAAFLDRCSAAGQTRPTPLLLRYEADDYNCLHQDLYGALSFPLQLTVLLSDPAADFTGGEFLLVEQRPRAQSRAEVVPLARGEAVIFAVQHRPVRGTRGVYRVALRHGVSRVRSGRRVTLGVIFHDAA